MGSFPLPHNNLEEKDITVKKLTVCAATLVKETLITTCGTSIYELLPSLRPSVKRQFGTQPSMVALNKVFFVVLKFTSAPSGKPVAAIGGGISIVDPSSLRIFPNVSAEMEA